LIALKEQQSQSQSHKEQNSHVNKETKNLKIFNTNDVVTKNSKLRNKVIHSY